MENQFAAEASKSAERPEHERSSPRRCDACKKQQDLQEPARLSAHDSATPATDVAPGYAGRPLDPSARLSSGPGLGHSISRIPVMAPAGTTGAALQQVHPNPLSGIKSPIQAKLAISQPGDALELEADRIAEKVMAMPAAVSDAPPRIQRFVGQATGGTNAAPASVDGVLAGSGRPLEPVLHQDMEQRFGHDFSRVRVHSGGAAEQSAREVDASAYTVGHNIVFGAGRFEPGTHEGQRLIAHELTHVVQQSGSDCCLSRTPLQTIANDFKTKVNVDPNAISSSGHNITETGQNFWTWQIWDRINNLIATDISAPLQSDFKDLAEAYTQLDNQTVADRTKKITQNPAYKTDQKAQKLFYDPDPRSGKEIYDTWWYTYRTKKALPDLTRYLTLPILNKITLYEIVACAVTVGNVFEVYKNSGGTGKGTRNTKNVFSRQLFASPTASRDTCRDASNTTTAVGDLVEYVSLETIIGKMKIALDDGFAFYTHVLSGYGVGHDAPMTDCNTPEQRTKSRILHPTISGEHYILIIGHENNKFLFWDAHASDSKEFGGGFGFLFYSNNRLTTAEKDSDLPVNENGDQSNGQHRYQPLTISTK